MSDSIEKYSFRPAKGARLAHVITAVLTASLGLVAACRLYDPCPQSSRAALAITIVDSVTGLPVASGASVVVSDGSFQQTIAIPESPSTTTVGAAEDRPGSYSIVVTRPGYRDWTRSGVDVQSDGCLPVTVAVTARLVPQP